MYIRDLTNTTKQAINGTVGILLGNKEQIFNGLLQIVHNEPNSDKSSPPSDPKAAQL